MNEWLYDILNQMDADESKDVRSYAARIRDSLRCLFLDIQDKICEQTGLVESPYEIVNNNKEVTK